MDYEFGPFRLEKDQKRLLDKGVRKHLPRKELQLLLMLVQNAGNLLSKEELIDAIWPDVIVEEATLGQYISRLRKALGDSPEGSIYIETEHGVGVRFIASVKEIDVDSPALSVTTVVSQPSRPNRHKRTWVAFARSVVTSHENRLVTDFPYARRPKDVPMSAIIGESSEYHSEVVSFFLEPKNLQPRILTFLVGDYGMGKTYTAGKLAYELAKKFTESPDGTTHLPIILQLRQTTSLSNIDSLIESAVRAMYGFAFSREALDAAIEEGRLVFILDGFDEMIARTDKKDIRHHISFLKQSQFFATTPIVITTRPNIIPNPSYYRRLIEDFKLVTIEPLDEKAVEHYLADELKLGKLVEALKTKSGTLLQGLLTRPLYLEMVTATRERILSELSLTTLSVERLYALYFEYWYDREMESLGQPPADLPCEKIKEILATVAQRLAHTKEAYLTADALRQCILEHASQDSASGANHLFVAVKERLILVPDFVDDDVRFSFRHDSLKAYFYAVYLSSRILNGSLEDNHLVGIDPATTDFLFAMAETRKELKQYFSQMSESLGESRSPLQRDILAFLWLRKLKLDPDPKHIRWLCGGDEEVRATILRNLSGLTFVSGCDFSGVPLSNANFTHSMLPKARFEGGTLVDADFSNADVTAGQFVDTNIALVKFGKTQLSEVLLNRVQGDQSDFTEASLKQAAISDSGFTNAKFVNANMREAVIRNSSFLNVSFNGTDLSNAKSEECRFEGCCTFTKASVPRDFFENCYVSPDIDRSGIIWL